MGKNQSASNLTNIIKQDASGNITFVSGSTTLMSVSSSGAITTTGVISGSNALSASYAVNATSASYAATSSYASAFNVAGTLTATTLVVQTITSSVSTITGSTNFGSLAANTHVFTGSLFVTGAFYVATGSVGIGMVSASAKFSVASDTNTSATNIARFSAANNTLAIGIGYETIRQTETGGIIKFETNAIQRMVIADNGNVGIGTTNPSSLVGTNLVVKGTVTATTGYIQALSYDSGSAVSLYSGASIADHPSIIYLKDLRFGSATDLGTGGYNERMRITTSGSVGIGTSSPPSYSGYTVLALNNATNGGVIDFQNNGTRVATINNDSTSFSIGSITSVPMVFYASGFERMRISSVGHVTKPYQPYFKYGMADISITSPTRFGTDYGFTVKTDRDAVDSPYFNKATGLFTAPVAGVYMFGCTIMRNAGGGSGPVDFWIAKNPSSLTARTNSYGRGYADSYSTAYQQFTIVVPIKLAINDTVALGFGGNMTIYTDDSWFYGYLLG